MLEAVRSGLLEKRGELKKIMYNSISNLKVRLESGGAAKVRPMRIVLDPAINPVKWRLKISGVAENVFERVLFKVSRRTISQTISLGCLEICTPSSYESL